jgi:MFS family permease
LSGTFLSADAQALRRGVRPHRPGVVLATLLSCQLMIVLDATVMNVALPRIQSDLHFSAVALSWVINSYTLVFGGLLLLGGRAGDLFGRRRLFIAGVLLFTLASLAGGLAQSAARLLIARVVQGLGAAAAGPSTLALLTTTFSEPKARLRALALFSAMASAAWPSGSPWAGCSPNGFRGGPCCSSTCPSGWRPPCSPPVTCANGWGESITLISLAAGVVLLAAFLIIEIRTEQPLLPLRLFADRNRAAYVNFFLGPMAGMAMFFFPTQYPQDVRGMSALRTGFAFLPMAVVVFGMTRLIPRLLPRFGPRPVALAGTAAMIAALALVTRLSTDSGYFPLVLIPLLLMGLGMGLAFSPLNVIIMSTVPPKDAGAAGGVLQSMQQTGGTLGLAILVTVFGSATRNATGSAHQILVTGMTHAFIASAIIAALTFVVALTFRRAR